MTQSVTVVTSKKKTVTDIKFLPESEVKDDPLTWNCLYINKYKDNN